jgi:integrase
MAGKWERVKDRPGMYRQVDGKGFRYKVTWRDAEGVQRSETFDRWEAAKGHQDDVRVSKRKHQLVPRKKLKTPLREVFAHMLRTGTLRPATRARYETHWRLYLEPAFGSRPVGFIAKDELKDFFAGLVSEDEPAWWDESRGKWRRRGVPTVESVHQLVDRLFNIAVEDDYIERTPMTGVRVVHAQPRPARILDVDEIRRLADHLGEPYGTLTWFLALSGLRIGEATALRVGSVDLKAGTVRVFESSPEVDGVKLLAQPTKTRKVRTVDIPPFLVKMLRDHLDASRPGWQFTPDALVFTGPSGSPIRQNAFRKRHFQKAARLAGLTPVPSVHDLRHTAASLYAAAGYQLAEAGDQLGHSATTMTARYTDVFPSHRQAKVKALDALVQGLL